MLRKVRTVKIVGPAGLGLKTSGVLLSKILGEHNFKTSDYTEYPSLIRGGHNTYQVSFRNGDIGSCYFLVDLLFSLKPGEWREHLEEFGKETLVFGDESRVKLEKGKFLKLPLERMIEELGHPLVGNTVCLGAAGFILGLKRDVAKRVIKDFFGKKARINLEAFDRGYNYAKKNYGGYQRKIDPVKKKRNLELYDGSEAFGWGFLFGKGDFYAAYPMTPSSGVLHFLAERQKEYNLKIELPEDEIAVANIASGASFGGARAAVGTSGGGYALMNECVSFCGMAEIGLVFYLAQREAPATGMPTWTAQGDLLYTVFSGHGEFAKVVLAPGDHKESFEAGWQGLNLADNLQTPVIVLTDKFLAEGGAGIEKLSGEKVKVDRGKLITNEVKGKFYRYETKFKCGRSYRTVPGVKGGVFLANSYEHDKTGLSTEDSKEAEKMVKKRMRKLETALRLTPRPVLHGGKKYKKLIVSWGSTKGPILEAMKLLDDPELAYLQIRTVWPLHKEIKEIIEKAEKKIIIENNFWGQMGMLLKMEFMVEFDEKILKYDGRPFFPEELYEKLRKI